MRQVCPILFVYRLLLISVLSLQTTWIRNSLLRAIRLSKNKANVHQIPSNFVYAHPSIQELGGYFWKVLTDNHDTSEESHATQIETRRLEMESLVTRYTAEISTPKWKTSLEPRREETILLTGSTGRLGCYVLKQLAENESIVKVYALNRASVLGLSAESKQKEALKLWGTSLDSDALKKIVYLEYDPSKDKLGLTEDTYSKVGVTALETLFTFNINLQLQKSVTTIVHNGWTCLIIGFLGTD